MDKHLTAHDLAAKLLALPDVPVVAYGEYDMEICGARYEDGVRETPDEYGVPATVALEWL